MQDLIYHLSVLLISIIMFSMKITFHNEILQLFLRACGKLIPLYCMLYAGIQIFKHFGII